MIWEIAMFDMTDPYSFFQTPSQKRQAHALAFINRRPSAWRSKKKFQSNRNNIVDSAPLCVYVHITLPYCEVSPAPCHAEAPTGLIHAADLRSSIMVAQDETRRKTAQKLYEKDGAPISAIAAQIGVTRSTIARWARLGHWERQALRAPQEGPIDRRALVTRAWRNAERQLRLVEKRVRAHAPDDAPLDESARLIATLVKTLRELTALDRTLAEDDSIHERAKSSEGDDIPRDLDALYQELADRMDRLRQERDSLGPAR